MSITDRGLSEEQRLMRASCRAFVDDFVIPFIRQNWQREWVMDPEARMPRSILERAGLPRSVLYSTVHQTAQGLEMNRRRLRQAREVAAGRSMGVRATAQAGLRLALFGACTLLLGCEHRPPSAAVPPPPQQVETGSRFRLNSPLAFPAGGTELLFQNEQLVPAGKLSRDMPYCKLTPQSGTPGTIQPGNFTVGSVNYDERETGAASGMVSVTRIALAADPNRPGYTLSCGWPEGAPSRTFVTTQQIFNAIGGQFSMDLLR